MMNSEYFEHIDGFIESKAFETVNQRKIPSTYYFKFASAVKMFTSSNPKSWITFAE